MCRTNVKRALFVVLSLVLVMALLAGVAVSAKREKKTFVLPDTSTAETSTNRYTQVSTAATLAGCLLNTEGFEKVIENDALELWFREEIDSIRIVDKNSGYIWGELAGDTVENLNDYWAAMANSILTLEYYDDNNTSYQMSLSDENFSCTYSFDDDADVLACNAYADNIGVEISFEIALFEDHFDAYVVEDSVYEDMREYKLAKLYLLPFFGCTEHKAMDGYIFVPDGSGALMRFDNNTLHTSRFSAKVYGPDAGIDTLNEVNDLLAKRTDDYLVDTFRVTVPVYGIVHGAEQYAAMTVISGGEEYATIQASLAATNVPYNYVNTVFEYRQLYSQPVSKSNSIIRPQAEINDFQPRLSIYLIAGEEANYSGMAVKYRGMLEEAGVLDDVAAVYEDQIPLRLEVLGSDVKAGFIFNSVQTFTTTDEALAIQTSLKDMGIENLTMVMTGWQKGGSNAYKYNSFKTQSTVGSMSDLEALRDSVVAAGGKFFLQNKVITFNEDQGRISYLGNQTISKKMAYYLRDNPTVMYPETYVAAPDTVLSKLQESISALKGFDQNIPRLGSELYAQFEQDATTTREKTRSLYEKAAKKVAEADTSLALNAPNQYMWAYCDDIFDVPMMNSQYLFESDSVPFLQILLKGHINYYAPYANQGFYTNACTLKSIEYGAYPSFLVMAEDNGTLNKTPMVDYFSLNFEDWKGTINTVYPKVNEALMQVEGAKMTEHKVLQRGLVRVTYDNGAAIYINYNNVEITVDDVQVPALNFVVAERG